MRKSDAVKTTRKCKKIKDVVNSPAMLSALIARTDSRPLAVEESVAISY
jgi:hypothetical protein